MITADVILDSVSLAGARLTTMRLRYPKFIHGELMTHRVFSRNASSSRAIPVEKNLQEALSDDRASPVYWGQEQRGMRAGAEPDEAHVRRARQLWKTAAFDAFRNAREMAELGLHKSVVNRILEPFLHINVLVSATEWLNFFGLRLDKDAQPEMRVLAETMWEAYQASAPQKLEMGDWHRPFIRNEDVKYTREYSTSFGDPLQPVSAADVLNRISVARCARVSYLSFETQRPSTIEEDLRLYGRLVGAQPLHASPAEHVATPDEPNGGGWSYQHEHGNFVGWRQFRKMLPGEACAPLPPGYGEK